MLSENLKSILPSSQQQQCWTFRPFVTTAAGSRVTNIRDQIRLLQSTTIDVLISTPGRLSTILRTRNSGLDLGGVMSLVLDEVDFLLVDESFSPQLRAVGAAVRRNDDDTDNDGNDDDIDDGKKVDDNDKTTNKGIQFIFVTATLPTDVLDVIRAEVPNITELRGPGLHRITPTVTQTLVDVSVPSSMNRNMKAGFDIKVRELHKALRSRRVDRTLVFCNTVETCRDVENALKRNDRSGRRSRVWAYHNALSPENRLKNLHSFSSKSSSREEYDNNNNNRSRSSSSSGSDVGISGVYAESVLVCTDRAARGVDFESNPVDHVILFDFPKDPAEYVRRVGRTARAGRAGASTVLAYGWQLPIARQIMGLGGGGSSSSSSGGGGGSDNSKKKGKGKRGNAKLEGFNMMKSDDGWDDELNDTKDDEYFVKGGARKRKEHGSVTTSSSTTPNKKVAAVSSKEKGKRTKSTDDGIGKSR
jgi:ATP-dependent RNA helicase DDX18/HAS1